MNSGIIATVAGSLLCFSFCAAVTAGKRGRGRTAVKNPPGSGISFAAFGLPPAVNREALLKEMAAHGCDTVYDHVNPLMSPEECKRLFGDIYVKYGIRVVPILNAYFAVDRFDFVTWKELPREKWGQKETAQVSMPSGKPVPNQWGGGYQTCPLNSLSIERAGMYVERVTGRGAKYPGFQILALDDEYNMGYGYTGDGMACYCDSCKEWFKSRTGLDAPVPVYRQPGYVAPKNDPYTKWRQLMGSNADGFASAPVQTRYNRSLATKATKARPGLKVIQMPGAFDGELDAVVTEIYGYMWSHPELLAGFNMDYHYARQGRRKRPLWPLIGWYSGKSFPAWVKENIGLQYKICLAKGARQIGVAPTKYFLEDARLKAAFQECGETIRTYGPVLTGLHRTKMPVAVLYSETTDTYQHILPWDEAKRRAHQNEPGFETPWRHVQSFEVGYPALWLAHVPFEIITERDILEDRLPQYKALVLVNREYSTAEIEEKIGQYTKSGGLVFADRSTVVRPEGAIDIPCDFTKWHEMIKQGLRPVSNDFSAEEAEPGFQKSQSVVRELIEPIRQTIIPKIACPITLDSTCISYCLSQKGNTGYLFLFNSDKENPRRTEVALNCKVEAVYNVIDKRKEKFQTIGNKAVFTAHVNKGDWQIYSFVEK